MAKSRVVNLEAGMPTVAQALAELDQQLNRARRDGVRILKVIHGYGSTGVGGAIKQAVHRQLARLKRGRRIREFVPGEDWSVFDEATRGILAECGDLGSDPDLKHQNEGISILFVQ